MHIDATNLRSYRQHELGGAVSAIAQGEAGGQPTSNLGLQAGHVRQRALSVAAAGFLSFFLMRRERISDFRMHEQIDLVKS